MAKFLRTSAASRGVPGTLVKVVTAFTSPHMKNDLKFEPSEERICEDFRMLGDPLVAPFRASLRGIIMNIDEVTVNNSDNKMRDFRLVDKNGAWIRCCAMFHNINSPALKAEQTEAVLYFGAGRGPIGTMPGKVYFYRDSIIAPLRVADKAAPYRQQIDIQGPLMANASST